MNTRQTSFLLINGSHDHYWSEVVGKALAPLGMIEIVTEREVTEYFHFSSYDVIIVDATAVENLPPLITSIRCKQPDARIVVATASPTWNWAREVFHAGAVDYIRKSVDYDELRSVIQTVLDKNPPSRL